MITGDTSTLAGVLLGRGDSDAVALADATRTVTYRDLRERVAEREAELALERRSVVLIGATNTTEFVVTYLALLGAGHVPLLAGDHLDRLAAAWRPAAIVTTAASGIEVERHADEIRPLHPDLRLLLSTSGSTGAPKLVRLSDRNLVSNAGAIVEILGLDERDRGITSLPLHYCYGLSVLHSHLAAGAAVVLTEASVVDPCFAAAMAAHGVTNLAGVPHTFELLERAGPERVHVPSLRFLTAAGGRLAPPLVTGWSQRCADWGAELFVMYGQTEATARMAYLPPALASRHPGAIGVAIPGGHLEVRPFAGAPNGAGELVYRGENVMLGYATSDDDLARGAALDELRTGDLGRYDAAAGVFEIVGRTSRFVKPFGVRMDLDSVERELAAVVGDVAVAGDDEHLAVRAPGADAATVASAVAGLTGLPPGRVAVDVTAGAITRTERGKVDYAAVLRDARPVPPGDPPRPSSTDAGSVAALYATILGRADVRTTDTFVSLGGDSLNYVECSLRLEQVVGVLPADWHLRAVGELEAGATGPGRRARLDTSVLLRAVGICTVVLTHMRLHFFPGGAHLLLVVVGYNMSRFQLPIESPAARLRAGLRTVGRAAVPTMAWVAAGMVLFGSYSVATLLLVNNYIGPASHRDDHWHFWFVEVFVHVCLSTTLLMTVPAVRRAERRFPYAFPLVLLLGALALRMEWAQLGDWYNLRFRTHGVAWFFVLGWLVHRSTTVPTKLLTAAVCVATIPGFFDRPQREWFIAAGLVLLLWCPQLPVPRAAMRPIAGLAAASMWILITHFTVWPLLVEHVDRRVAYALTLGAGVAAWTVVEHGGRLVRGLPNRRRSPAPLLAA